MGAVFDGDGALRVGGVDGAQGVFQGAGGLDAGAEEGGEGRGGADTGGVCGGAEGVGVEGCGEACCLEVFSGGCEVCCLVWRVDDIWRTDCAVED